MNGVLVLEQILNGLQFGVMLFLITAGLTLTFGIMNLVNLAHGILYMLGAYFCARLVVVTGSFLGSIVLALAGAVIVGILIELLTLKRLYARNHLDQVLATFGVTLFFNEIVRVIWGPASIYFSVPTSLSGQIELIPGLFYPAYRLVIIAVGLAAAASLVFMINFTKLGMLIRAGASNRVMVSAMGVNINLLNTLVFGLGAGFAALAGAVAGPLLTVESGMGNDMLILALVVIVIGGIGSIKGAFIASLAVGLIDTFGRTMLRPLFELIMSQKAANNAGPAVASMLIYLAMALVLFFRPQGLFPPRTR